MSTLKERLASFNEFVQDVIRPERDDDDNSQREQEKHRQEMAKLESFTRALAVARQHVLPVFRDRRGKVRESMRKAIDNNSPRAFLYWSGYLECLQDVISDMEDTQE